MTGASTVLPYASVYVLFWMVLVSFLGAHFEKYNLGQLLPTLFWLALRLSTGVVCSNLVGISTVST